MPPPLPSLSLPLLTPRLASFGCREEEEDDDEEEGEEEGGGLNLVPILPTERERRREASNSSRQTQKLFLRGKEKQNISI